MAVKRQQLTFRGLKRRMERDEQRDLKRTQGRWYYPHEVVTDDILPSDLSVDITLPTPQDHGILIYGMDLILSITFQASEPAGTTLLGALQVCHIRPGQTKSDFLAANGALPSGEEAQSLARPRSFLPFWLQNEQNDYRSAVIPYRFFRGHQIRLNPGEFLSYQWAFPTTSTGKVTARMGGRYRYIERPGGTA